MRGEERKGGEGTGEGKEEGEEKGGKWRAEEGRDPLYVSGTL